MLICLCQTDTVWNDPDANHRAVEALLHDQPPTPGDLLVLPEMFATGFDVSADVPAEPVGGPSEKFVRGLASRYGCTVAAGLVQREHTDRAVNIALLAGPDGQVLARYRKVHLFAPGGEREHFAPGDDVVLAAWGPWTLCPTICYDLRFPELYRRGMAAGADLVLVLANWPAGRQEHWLALLQARAIENQAVVVGVNRCGQDPHVRYGGGSVAFDARGECLGRLADRPGLLRVAPSHEETLAWRADFAALADIRWRSGPSDA